MRPYFNVYQPWRREALLFSLQVARLGEGDAPVHALQGEGSQPQQTQGACGRSSARSDANGWRPARAAPYAEPSTTHHGGSPRDQQDLKIWLEPPETER